MTIRAPAGMFPLYTPSCVWLAYTVDLRCSLLDVSKYSKQTPRGHESLGWITYAALDLGLVLRAIAEPIHGLQATQLSGLLLVLSAMVFRINVCCQYMASCQGKVNATSERSG
jgi:hypothetical protein